MTSSPRVPLAARAAVLCGYFAVALHTGADPMTAAACALLGGAVARTALQAPARLLGVVPAKS